MKNVTPENGAHLARTAWDRAVSFHGHACPGLAMGCRLALAAVRALGIDDSFLTKPQGINNADPLPGKPQMPVPSPDEELVCVSETDACGVDAVQCLLGCTAGKGNLFLNVRGKSAMRFFHRPSGRAARVLWIAPKRGEHRDAVMEYYLSAPEEELVSMQEIPFDPPSRALISPSVPCAGCGEAASEALVRMADGKPYCLDCAPRS